MSKQSPLIAAITKATKDVKVHQLPKQKEPKGLSAGGESFYYPPTIHLSDKDFAGMVNWQVDQEVNLAIRAKVTHVNTYDSKDKNERNCILTITAIADLGGKA